MGSDVKLIRLLHMCLLIVISLSGYVCRDPVASYCWSSGDDSVHYNQSCVTGEKQHANMVSLTDSADNHTDFNNSGNTMPLATQCFAHKYTYSSDNDTLKYDTDRIKARVAHKNFSCDFDGICKNRPTGKWLKINETSEGYGDGELFCCNSDNCNKLENLPKVHDYRQVCQYVMYNGSYATGHDEICDSDKTFCTRFTMYKDKDKTIDKQLYKCDNKNTCQLKNLTAGTFSCVNIKTPDVIGEQCCCIGDKCIPKPTYQVHLVKDTGSPDFNMEFPKVIKKMTKAHSHPDWLLIGGIIAAAVLVVVFILSVVIVVHRCKKKQSRRGGVSLTYSRIAADSVPEDDDVQMLLS